MPHRQPLPPEALKFSADFSALELPEIPRTPLPVLGQPRAQNALEFGVAMNRPGYHIFVLGEPGLGRLSMIRQQLDALAQTQPAAHAYAYVNNFDNAHEPLALQLPAGHGQDFAKHIEKLLDDVLAIFPATFENPAYQQKKTALERQFNQAYNHALDLVDNKARAVDIALCPTATRPRNAPPPSQNTFGAPHLPLPRHTGWCERSRMRTPSLRHCGTTAPGRPSKNSKRAERVGVTELRRPPIAT